jgi:hypothetical protein
MAYVHLHGHIGREPEVKHLGETLVCTFLWQIERGCAHGVRSGRRRGSGIGWSYGPGKRRRWGRCWGKARR